MKRRAILFFFLTALYTVLLAVALPQLVMQPGTLPPRWPGQTQTLPLPGSEPPPAQKVSTLPLTVFGFFILLVFGYLFVKRRGRLGWAEIVQVLLAISTFSLVMTFLLYLYANVKLSVAPLPVGLSPIGGLSTPFPAPVPTFLFGLTWFGLAGLVFVLVVMGTRVRIRRRVARDPLAQEAEQAVEALKAEQGFSNYFHAGSGGAGISKPGPAAAVAV